MNLTLEGFRTWLDDYGKVWEKRDTEAFDRLYRDDIRYYETPFDDPMVGLDAVRQYSTDNSSAQRDVRFTHEAYAVAGDRGLARWWASFERVPSGVKVELDGFFSIRLDENIRCFELREWWHRRES